MAHRGIGLVSGMASAALLGWIYWQMLDFTIALPPDPTSPNSLPRVMQLGTELQWKKANPRQAQPIFDELLVRLAEPGYVPINYRSAQREWAAYTPVDIQLARQIARDMKAEGERLHAAGKSDEAADYVLATMQLGLMFQREGSGVEWIVGIAIESIGHDELARIRATVGPSRREALAGQLGRLDSAALPIDQVLDRCHQFALISEGWRYRFELLLQQDLWQGTNPRFKEQLTSAWLRRQTLSRLLLVDLAIRRFHDERGAWPDRLEQLVPTYLPAVPLDPNSEQPLIYRQTGSGFLLYSVGADRHDDGGKLTNRTTYHNAGTRKVAGWDFDLDTLNRP